MTPLLHYSMRFYFDLLILSFSPSCGGHWWSSRQLGFSSALQSQSTQFGYGTNGCLSPGAMTHLLIYGYKPSFQHFPPPSGNPYPSIHSYPLVSFPLSRLQGNSFWKTSKRGWPAISWDLWPKVVGLMKSWHDGQWPASWWADAGMFCLSMAVASIRWRFQSSFHILLALSHGSAA